MRTASYSLMENSPLSIQCYYSEKGFLYAAWNVHSIYTYYVKYYVYTVNGWIGTVYLVMQLYEKSECQLWKLCTNFV